MESTREKWRKITPTHPKVTNISELPENLLVHIISFLPIKDAIATSFLSKAWRNLWTHTPSLDFKYNLIVPDDYHSDNPDDDWRTNDAERAKIYASFVDQALQRYHHPNLRSLSINFSYDDNVAHHVDNWLQIAARNNIQELNVDFFIYLFDLVPHLYNLSLSFLSSASLTTLNLHHLRLVSSSGTTFRSLRTLSLFDVDFGNEIMLDIIAGCPELQNLALNICLGMHRLKISSSRLKNLSIINCGSRHTSFEIDAPNLISFECQNDLPTVDNYSFEDLSSLVNARVMFGYLPQFSNNDTHVFNRLRKTTPEVFASARILTLQNCWSEGCLGMAFNNCLLEQG